jgi:hypothetical protein
MERQPGILPPTMITVDHACQTQHELSIFLLGGYEFLMENCRLPLKLT